MNSKLKLLLKSLKQQKNKTVGPFDLEYYVNDNNALGIKKESAKKVWRNVFAYIKRTNETN